MVFDGLIDEVKIYDRALAPEQDCRVGHVSTLEGTDLIVWLKLEARQPTTILFSSETGQVGAAPLPQVSRAENT
jgi:hypothetical protein